MNRRTVCATGLVSIAFSLALGAGASHGATQSQQSVPGWERALVTRSRALDRRYRLGSYRPLGAGIVPPGRHPAWLRALDRRSIGLDRRYRLGSFAPPTVF